MKRLIGILALLQLFLMDCPGQSTAPELNPAGHWMGELKIGQATLRLALNLTRTASGFTGTIDSLDQGANDIPVSAVRFKPPQLELEIKSIAAGYSGQLAADDANIQGLWKQGGQEFPLVFKRAQKPATLNRPQEPARPYPYLEEQVTVSNDAAGVKLAGTFTRPKTDGPHAAVVLITGSGPQDRDESLMGHKPFLILADFLTRRGIAVLRLDDRGVGGSTGNLMNSTDADLALDALAAVAWLKNRRDIDPQHIGLIGHSEGGLIAPLAASQEPGIAFIVLMAGPGVPMAELLQTQAADLARLSGAGPEQIDRVVKMQAGLLEVLKKSPDNRQAEIAIRQYWLQSLKDFTPEELKAYDMAQSQREAQLQSILTPWFRSLAAYDPKPALLQTRCPVLAINGQKDIQVASKPNLAAIAAALKEGGNTDFKTIELPGLNHLFQPCKTGHITEYARIEQTFSPAALKVIGDWIQAHAKPGRQ